MWVFDALSSVEAIPIKNSNNIEKIVITEGTVACKAKRGLLAMGEGGGKGQGKKYNSPYP